MTLNPNTKKRLQKFRANKRAYYSFLFLLTTYVISLFAPILVNDTPILVHYKGSTYFPIFKFYPDKTFGGKQDTVANYKKLRNSPQFQESGNFMLFPIVSYGYNESNMSESDIRVAVNASYKGASGSNDTRSKELAKTLVGNSKLQFRSVGGEGISGSSVDEINAKYDTWLTTLRDHPEICYVAEN